MSALVVIPAGISGGQISGGEKKKSFHVMSSTGKNVSDALVNMQSKLSRVLFSGHRDIFLVGQRLAEHGIGKTIDPFLRNAQSDMRSLIYIGKDGHPKDVFSIDPFFDPYITSSLLDEQTASGLKPYLVREFVIDVLSDGTQPLVPVVSLHSSKHYSYTGSAILNKDDGVKLVGFLNKKETSYARWITDRLTSFTITSFIPRGDSNVSLTLESLDRRIRVKQIDKRIQIKVHLHGEGTIIENNTNLDHLNERIYKLLKINLHKRPKRLSNSL